MPASPSPHVHLYVHVRIAGHLYPNLVPQMLRNLRVSDRTFMLRHYPRVFTGADAVHFLISKRVSHTEQEAIALGNALLKAGLFRHVHNEHLFRNGNYFYRFAAHEHYAPNAPPLNLPASRVMSVACNSFLKHRISTSVSPVSPKSSDAMRIWSPVVRLEYSERDVVVEIGIRIGDRNFPKLVSHLTCDVNLLRTGEGGGKNGKLLHNVFSGVEACKWLLQHAYATHMNEAVAIGNALLMSGVLYAVEGYSQAWEVGFDSEGTLYRSMAHTDLSRELKKGARKDMLLRLLGVGRGKTSSASAILAQQSPWFEEQFSESFTSSSSAST